MTRVIEYLLYLFIFFIPWQARWVIRVGAIGSPSKGSGNNFWEYGTVALYATDLIFALILALSIIWFIQKKVSTTISNFKFLISKQSSSPKSQIFKVTAYCLLLTAYAFFSIFWSSEKLVTFYAALKLFEGIALFFLIRSLPIDRSKLVWAFVASAVAQSILAVAQFFMQSVFVWPFSGIAPQDPSDLGVSVVQFADERWLRAYGSFPHPNALGTFLAIALLLMTSQIAKIKSKKILFASGYLLVASGLFLTFSRAAWIAFLVGFIIYVVQSKAWREKIFLQLTLLLVVTTTVLTVLFFPLVRTRIGGGSRLEIQSNQERTTGYREAAQLIRRHPFVGVGIGNYTAAVARELRPNDLAWSYQPVHNVFLLVLSELGFVGFVLFAISFLLLIKKLRVTSYQLLIPLAILASFDHSLWTLHSGIFLLWLTLAMDGA